MRVKIHCISPIWMELDQQEFDVLDAQQKLWCVEITIDVSRFDLEPKLPDAVRKQFKVDLVQAGEIGKIKTHNGLTRSSNRIVIGLLAEPVGDSAYSDAYRQFIEPKLRAHYAEIEARELARQQPL